MYTVLLDKREQLKCFNKLIFLKHFETGGFMVCVQTGRTNLGSEFYL